VQVSWEKNGSLRSESLGRRSEENKMDWFTADWHLNHKNIIRFCNRPYTDIEQHNEALIANVNAVVKPDDRLFNLGDVTFGGNLALIRASIVCKNVFVILGNHDKESQLRTHFTILPQCYEYKNNGLNLVLCHYAMRVWNKSHHGVGHLYGHSHNTMPSLPGVASFDCGVDGNNYRPWSEEEVKTELKRLVALAPEVNGEHLHHEFRHTGREENQNTGSKEPENVAR
jgi:calcineurin-like phosphoesterase family protein